MSGPPDLPGPRIAAFSESTLEALQMLLDIVVESMCAHRAALSLVEGDELVVSTVSVPGDEVYDGPGLRWARWPCSALAGIAESGQAGHHPMAADALLAPLRGADGALIGCLSLEGPGDGRAADEAVRTVLERWASYAASVVVDAFEREQLQRRAGLLDGTRDVLRMMSGSAERSALLAQTQSAVLAAFAADSILVQTFREQGWGTGSDFSTTTGTTPGLTPLTAMLENLVRVGWRRQQVFVYDDTTAMDDPALTPHLEAIQSWMERNRAGSVLMVPIGAGPEAMGSLLVIRGPARPRWSRLERRAAIELGRDVGEIVRASRAQRRERQLARELRDLDSYKNDLVRAVTQELQDPLSVIVGSADRIGASGAAPPQRGEVRPILRAARLMGDVVDDLLLLSRVTDPDHQPQARLVDLAEVASEAVAQLDAAAAGRRQALTLRAAGPAVVLGEAAELEHVVRALLANAVRYTEEGGSVTVGVETGTDGVELTVSDTGIGIAESEVGRVFDAFFRTSHPGVRSQPGGGLGLAIAERIVARHGGTITVESALGEGSTFRVLLPVA